jgi:hypothetical protein
MVVDADDDADDGDVLDRLDRLAADATAEHGVCARLQSQALTHALECGRIINEARAAIPHGNTTDWDGPSFQEWLDQTGIPKTTAKRYQHVDKGRHLLPDDPDSRANMGIIEAIELIDLLVKLDNPPLRDHCDVYDLPEARKDQIDHARRVLKQWHRLRRNIEKLTHGFKLYLWWEIKQDISANLILGWDEETQSQIDWALDPNIADEEVIRGCAAPPPDPDEPDPEDEQRTEGASDDVIDLHPATDGTYSAEDADADQGQRDRGQVGLAVHGHPRPV